MSLALLSSNSYFSEMVEEWDAASWPTSGGWIYLWHLTQELHARVARVTVEFDSWNFSFIKWAMKKMEIDRPKKKTNTPLQKNKTKTKQVKAAAARVWHARTNPDLTLTLRSGYEITLDLTQAGWLLLPLLKSLRCHCSEFKTKKTHTHSHTNWNTIVIDALYTWDIFA